MLCYFKKVSKIEPEQSLGNRNFVLEREFKFTYEPYRIFTFNQILSVIA